VTTRPVPGPRSTIPVEDRLAVMELISRYPHLYDAGVADGLGDLFAEDAVMETTPQPAQPPAGYPFPARGREAVVAALTGFQDVFIEVRRRHLTDSPSLTRVADDEIRAVTYFAVIHTATGASTEIVGAGCYEDVVRRGADGVWRISHRTVHRDRRGPQVTTYY
jgi:hypothetical protein